MKKFAVALAFILTSLLIISCSGSDSKSSKVSPSKDSPNLPQMAQFKHKDFSFEYPADWDVATDSDVIDTFGGIGVVAVNSFGEKDFWVKEIQRKDLIHTGGGLFVNRLPKDGVYMFVMNTGATGEKPSKAKSVLNASTKPYGDPAIFREGSFKVTSNLDGFPEEERKEILEKWTVNNDWLHYRAEFANHGIGYDAHIYVLGDAVKTDKKTAEAIIKSIKLVDPADSK